jgi:hypothetical protein
MSNALTDADAHVVKSCRSQEPPHPHCGEVANMQQGISLYRRWLVPALGGALVLSAAACFDNNNVPPTNAVVPVATSIAVNSGNRQAGVVGQPLFLPIVVHVSDQSGASLKNAVVNWTVLTGGGSVSAVTSLTDDNGNASVIWTMGPTVGAVSLRAEITNGASVTTTATVNSA